MHLPRALFWKVSTLNSFGCPCLSLTWLLAALMAGLGGCSEHCSEGNWPGRSLLSPLLCTGDGDDPHEVPEQSVQCNREKKLTHFLDLGWWVSA